MELIDKETAYKELSEFYHHTAFIQHLALSEALDRVPVVDAVPVSYIQQRIESLQSLADYQFDASGGYTGQAHTEIHALKQLIKDWREQRDTNQDKTD